MTNLIKELGSGYFRDRFGSSLFYTPEDKLPAYVVDVVGNGVAAKVSKGTLGKLSSEDRVIPNEFFKDMSVFAVPPLGWRCASKGRYLAHYTRNNRSYNRGVTLNNTNKHLANHTQYLLNTDDLSFTYYERPGTIAAMIMAPEYMRISDGLRKMNEGTILSFVVSPNLAVVPETEERYGLMFNTMRVGEIDVNGRISCTIPVVERMVKESM